MKLALSVAILALVVAAVSADVTPKPPTPATGFCATKDTTGNTSYRDPKSDKGLAGNYNCMKYHDCKDGRDNVHYCFWLLPLRQYNPTKRHCDWFWNVKCADPDPTN